MKSSSKVTIFPSVSRVPFDPALSFESTLEYVAATNSSPPSLNPPDARLPGYPKIHLNNASLDTLFTFLQHEFCTPDLDAMSPYLGLVAKQSSAHVTPLHGQLVRGRSIVLSEDPNLHLLWIHERVFIKPLPLYMLSHAFWKFYLIDGRGGPQNANCATLLPSILGFLRTYSLLIRYESDFRLAKDLHLLPEVVDDFTQFIDFMTCFQTIDDSCVSGRYHFGELRLSRLNFWAKIILRKWSLQKVHWAYSAYFAEFYGPLLFAFGVLSLFLSAMQVVFATGTLPSSWQVTYSVFRNFSVAVLIFLLAISALLMALFMAMALREIIYASRDYIGNHTGQKVSRRDRQQIGHQLPQ